MSTILGYLDGPRDEERVAGLLLLGKREKDMTEALALEVAAKVTKNHFLERLLLTEDGEGLSAAQRVGLAVATQLARCGAAEVLRRELGDAVDALIEDDVETCLDCAVALRSRGPVLVNIVRQCEHECWETAVQCLTEGTSVLEVRSVEAVLEAAQRCREHKDRYGWEAALLTVAATSWIFAEDDVDVARRSSEARSAQDRTRTAVLDALPRLLVRGGAPEWQRDAALRLASVATEAFGTNWLRGTTMTIATRVFAAEARLSLDEALALCFPPDDDDPKITDDRRSRRVAAVAPLCLGFLERLVDALVGEPSDSDDEDDDLGLEPSALLDVRAALMDAADAALAFVTEVRLHNDLRPVPLALDLCRDAFRYLGRLALDLDDDDDDPQDDDDDDDSSGSIHSRLAALRPFVSHLMALDQEASTS